jgi:uncharacterized membrane protein
MMMGIIGIVFEPLGIFVVIGLGLVIALGLQQRRLNKKRGLGIFESHSKSTRNVLGWRY